MSVPEQPLIRLNPVASPNALSFYWSSPQNLGPSPILGYTLMCSSINFSQSFTSNASYTQVSSLTNSFDYVFQLAAQNSYGLGQYATFLSAQPGNQSAGVTNLAVSTINETTANVVWSFSNNINEATNKYFTISVYPSTSSASVSSFMISLYEDQRSKLITNLSTMYYNFVVQSINDAGYSFPNVSSLQLIATNLFTPPLISGLQVWLDGNDPNNNGTPGFDGFNLSTWYDKSGNSRNMTFSGSGISYANGSINSLNTISLNGITIGTIGVPVGTFSSNYCGFVIYKSSVGNNTMFGRTDTAGWAMPFDNFGGTTRYCGVGVSNRIYIGNSAFNTSSSAPTTTLWNFSLSNYASTGGTGSYNEYSNGSIVSITGGQTTSLNAADNSPNIYFTSRAGNLAQVTANYCEILIYNTNLSTSSRQKIEGYLAWKWGIQTSLPISHPYYLEKPLKNSPNV
jgi:hypothetical protein